MSDYQRLLHQIADYGRLIGNMMQFGTVEEVKKDRFRAKIGKGADGSDVLGPWIDTGDHRGGARERRFYKKGQNIAMFSPTGDPAQAVQFPFAPNEKFKPPDQANESGQDEETYQQGDLRVRKKGKGYEIWLEQGDKSGEGGKSNNGGNGNGVNEKVFLQKGSVTGRVGKNWFVAHEKGAKLQADKQYAVVTPEKLIVSKPWEVGKDPINQDDKGQQGGQESTSGGAPSKGSGSP
jgi:hypothetical protein